MANFDEKISQLQGKLIRLIENQEKFQKEILEMRAELNLLKIQAKQMPNLQPSPEKTETKINEVKETLPPQDFSSQHEPQTNKTQEQKSRPQVYQPIFNRDERPKPQSKFESKLRENINLEKFIGENLISLIGIIILTIGVAIGAKYAIDKNWITPLMRIIAGYVFGIALVGLAVKLKPKYLNFSAVLLSGGMAIMYFITYFAYSFYSLINQPTSFVLMLIFTVFTVASALNYDRQIIAHIGLVGAYAIPLLLSNNSGNYVFLFTYVVIINIGILAISVKKYWKPLFYSSYIVTWLIFSVWYLRDYSSANDFYPAMFFLSAFFLIFYLTFIAYKLVSKENIAFENVALILANSFIFYGFGYSMIKARAGMENFLGMFTVANAAIHFVFSFAISRLKLATNDLVFLTAALVLTFITIAVPVQLDGNVITLIWSAEAAILFWIGRTKQISLFENYSYPLMLIASGNLLLNWLTNNFRLLSPDGFIYPFLNSDFAVGIFFIAAFLFIWILSKRIEFPSSLKKEFSIIVDFAVSSILLFAIYNTFRIEIRNLVDYYFLVIDSTWLGHANYISDNYEKYNILWQMNYSMLFLTTLSFLNIFKFKNTILGFINLILNGLIVFFLLTFGLFILEDLRSGYFAPENSVGIFGFLIRYICYAFFAALSFASFKYVSQEFLTKYIPEKVLKVLFDLGFYFSVLVLISVELINWMEIFNYADSFKLGLSILWGIYAVFLIVLGIVLRKLHLRIFAITLFTVTLMKLFFYDIAHLDTISKTVVFVSLGILLLIISFLYTKYKNVIFEEKLDAD